MNATRALTNESRAASAPRMRRTVSNGGSDHVPRLWLENWNQEQYRRTVIRGLIRAWSLC